MIDIHSHILWDTDDGPESFEESLEMMRAASAAGTTDIVATPHLNQRFPFEPERNRARIEQLRAALAAPRIHPGCELLLTYENVQRALEDPTPFTINAGSYLLVEFSHLFLPASLAQIFHGLLDKGIRPVIAHPERNPAVAERRSDIASWLACGCVLQITAQSLEGAFGPAARQFGWSLIESGEAQVVASDAHDCRQRPPRLDQVRMLIEERLDAPVAERLLVANPALILQGLPVFQEKPAAPRKSWYQFWR